MLQTQETPRHLECKYYPDHADRYKHLTQREREQLPDEVYVVLRGWIKREKDFKDMTRKDFSLYGRCIRLAAKDIPIDRAIDD